jgi:hypothetical protein
VTKSPAAEIASGSGASAPRARGVPRTARVFIGLAVVDIAVRGLLLWLGSVLSMDGFRPTESPVGLADLLILLPALILVRRPTAAADTPLVLWGAVVVAGTAFATGGIARFIGLPADGTFRSVQEQVLETLAWTAGVLLLARGLTALNPRTPGAFAAGSANLATGAIVVAALVSLMSSLINVESHLTVFLNLDLPASLSSIGAATVGQLGIAYLVRSVGRGLEDPSRAERATRLGSIAGVLYAVTALISAVLIGIEEVTPWHGVPGDVFTALGFMAGGALVLLAAAFALGLADPLRPLPKEWETAAAPEG